MARRISGPGVVLSLVGVVAAITMSTASERTLVPTLPASVTIQSSSLFNIWTHALRNQLGEDGQSLRTDEPGPKTILAPLPFRMVNLVPQDGPHPLYSNEFIDLRTEFLLDYMIHESVSPDDERMSQSEGLTVKNLNGKNLTFKKDAEGKITVEGIKVENFKTLKDGIFTYALDEFLFNHQEKVDEARRHLLKTRPKYDAFGRRMDLPSF